MPRDVRNQAEQVEALLRDLERAMWAGEDPRLLVPQLVELARISRPGSEAWLTAYRQLAATAAETDPWRASLLARRLLEVSPDDFEALGALGLAQSLLGNMRYAVRCYERALEIAGHDACCEHNLGHLYDAVLDQPERAVPLLARAMEGFASSTSRALKAEVAASYAHALARVGRHAEARAVLVTALENGRTRQQAELMRWIESESQVERP